MEDDVEIVLRQHHVPQSDALARRIASVAMAREEKQTLWGALGELLKPAPVAALACSLMLGLMASRHLPYADAPTDSARPSAKISHNAGAFLYYNGEIL